MGVLEVGEPAAQRPVEVLDDAFEALAPRALRFGSDAVLQLVQTLLAYVTFAGLEPVAEELETLSRLPAVADVRLLGMQHEAVLVHPGAHGLEGGLRLLERPAQDHEIVRVPGHAVSALGDERIQRVQIGVGQQGADYGALRRALRRRPRLLTFEDVGLQPASDQIEHPAIADLRLDPRHQTIVGDRVEIALQVGVHHEGVAFLDQPIDLPQRVMASASRTEAVAPLAEPHLENRFDHEPDRLLDDAILDRRNAQRPRPAIALRDVDPLDGLWSVRARPQRRRQLGQILVRPNLEPFDALPIHARRAFVGPDFRPGRRQRIGREHLVHQCIPFAAFDAVDQRRQHAFRPNRRVGPRQVPCSPVALCSLIGTPGVVARFSHRASPFLPPFPKTGLCGPVLSRPVPCRLGRSSTMRVLTPARLAQRRTGLSAYFALPSEHPTPNHVMDPSVVLPVVSTHPSGLATQASPRMRRLADPPRRNGFVILQAVRSLPAALHLPLRATQLPSASCVTTSHRMDFHPPDKATSQTHSCSRTRASRTPRASEGFPRRVASAGLSTCAAASSPHGWIPAFAGMTRAYLVFLAFAEKWSSYIWSSP